jgi:hypothetical protein
MQGREPVLLNRNGAWTVPAAPSVGPTVTESVSAVHGTAGPSAAPDEVAAPTDGASAEQAAATTSITAAPRTHGTPADSNPRIRRPSRTDRSRRTSPARRPEHDRTADTARLERAELHDRHARNPNGPVSRGRGREYRGATSEVAVVVHGAEWSRPRGATTAGA